MSPKQLLELWRERWGKGEDGQPDRLYEKGSVHSWLHSLAKAGLWEKPMMSAVVIFLSVIALALLSKIEFAFNGQITFSGLLLTFIFFARRYSGALFSLLIVCLSLVACSNYFYWRFAHTIVLRSSQEMLMSLSLCAVELCVAFYFFVKAMNRLWPVVADSIPVLKSDSDLPTVTLLVNVTPLDHQAAIEFLEQCKALRWPARKFKIAVIDARPRGLHMGLVGDRLYEFCGDNEFELLSAEPQVLDAAITNSTGDFVLMLDAQSHQPLPTDALQRLTGWFDEQIGLSLVYSQCTSQLLAKIQELHGHTLTLESTNVSFVMLRKSAWLTLEPIAGASFNRKIDRLRQHSALVVQRIKNSTKEWVRIDRADSALILKLKSQALAFEAMLLFYKPVAIACLLMLPIATWVAGYSMVSLMRSKVEWLAVLAIPYGVSLYVLHERLEPLRRWGLFKVVKELFLSAYMSFRSADAFVRASWNDPSLFLKRSFGTSVGTSSGGTATLASCISYVLIALNALAFCMGFSESISLYSTGGYLAAASINLFILLLAITNIVMLLARQAVKHESQHIEWFIHEKRCIPVSIVLASGRTIACTTLNFPQSALQLRLPHDLSNSLIQELMGTILLQFRHGLTPFNVTAHTLKLEKHCFFVETSNVSKTVYLDLKAAVMSRTNDWPRWLPQENADQLLPKWISDRLNGVPAKVVDFLVKVSGFFNLKAIFELIKK